MTLDEYQTQAAQFAQYPELMIKDGDTAKSIPWGYSAFGLAGEAGEVVEKLKKVIRNCNGEISEIVKWEIRDELGDLLWNIGDLAKQVGLTLSEIGQCNIDKLTSRAARGVICGEGDNR